MKKIVALFTLLIAAVLCIVTVGAEELPADPEEDVSIITDNGETNIEQTLETGYLSRVFDHVLVFVEENKDTIIMIVGFVESIFIALKEKVQRKHDSVEKAESLSYLVRGVSEFESLQDKMIAGYNALAEAYDKMRDTYNKYEAVEDDRNKLVGAVMVQCSAMLDILTSVYTNSSHLPQGEKDLILYKYSKCLSALDSDEKLRACMDAVRDVMVKE